MKPRKKISNKLNFLLKAFSEHSMFSVAMLFCFFFLFNSFSLWPCYVACGILVPQSGIKPRPWPRVLLSPNHWTAREFPAMLCLLIFIYPMAQPVLTQNNIPLSWCLMTCI